MPALSRSRFVVVAVAAAAAAAPSRLPAQENGPVRLGAVGTDNYAEAYYADARGAFTAAGVEATVVTFPNGGALVQGAAANAIDAGIADMIQLANAAAHGVPLQFFAGGNLYASDAPTTMLCVAKNGRIRSAKDFEGQTIAVFSLRTLAQFSSMEWLRQRGADPSKVRFLELSGSAMAAAVERGAIAGAMLSEPFLSAALGSLQLFGKPYDAVAKRFYINCWFGRAAWIARDPETARRVAQAMYATARWVDEHHDASAAILAKYTRIGVERIRHMTRAEFATSLDPKLMQPVLDLGWKYQALEKPVAAASLIATAFR